MGNLSFLDHATIITLGSLFSFLSFIVNNLSSCWSPPRWTDDKRQKKEDDDGCRLATSLDRFPTRWLHFGWVPFFFCAPTAKGSRPYTLGLLGPLEHHGISGTVGLTCFYRAGHKQVSPQMGSGPTRDRTNMPSAQQANTRQEDGEQ